MLKNVMSVRRGKEQNTSISGLLILTREKSEKRQNILHFISDITDNTLQTGHTISYH